jgi:Skp family chaperone for outer membrane proteins
VKRSLIIVGGLLALAATAYVGTRLWAQGTGTPAAPAQTRIAFVNIEIVFQNYTKAKNYKKEMEDAVAPFRAEAEKLKADMIKWQRELDDPTSPTKIPDFNKERWAEGIKANKRKLEDLSAQVGKVIGKKNEEQVTQLYKEVNDMVQRHAAQNGFHAVLCYGESTKLSPLGFENISRKVQGMEGTGCLSFMYVAPGLDISQAVTDALNRNYSPNAASGGTGSGVVPTAGK